MSTSLGSERVTQGLRLCAAFLPSAGAQAGQESGRGMPNGGDEDISLPGCPGLTGMLFLPPPLVPWLCSPKDAVFQASAAIWVPHGLFCTSGGLQGPRDGWKAAPRLCSQSWRVLQPRGRAGPAHRLPELQLSLQSPVWGCKFPGQGFAFLGRAANRLPQPPAPGLPVTPSPRSAAPVALAGGFSTGAVSDGSQAPHRSAP